MMTSKALSDAVIKVLVDARAFLTPEPRWIKYAWAIDADGGSTNIQSLDAVAWCALGGLEHTLIRHNTESPIRCLMVARSAAMGWLDRAGAEIVGDGNWESVDTYNDLADTTHADVLALYDRAIALAKASAEVFTDADAEPPAVLPIPAAEPEPELVEA